MILRLRSPSRHLSLPLCALALVCALGACSSRSSIPLTTGEDPATAVPSSPGPSSPVGSSAGGSPSGTGSAAGSSELPPAAAAARLAKARIAIKGVPVAATSWRDENTLNILLVSVETSTASAGTLTTTRAYLAAGLEQADGGRLRDVFVDDNGGPCDNDGGSSFVPGSFSVADLDGDGHTEATAGWTSSCRGDPGPVGVSLILFSRGQHYRLTGTGQVQASPLQSPFDQGVPPVRPRPDPAQASWPGGLYAPTLALFTTLYR